MYNSVVIALIARSYKCTGSDDVLSGMQALLTKSE
uniref:Uncharacterized protein n=1 Tax=Anopheles albimanus TaxID=7167 RepID=A0A182FZ22_ANOAL